MKLFENLKKFRSREKKAVMLTENFRVGLSAYIELSELPAWLEILDTVAGKLEVLRTLLENTREPKDFYYIQGQVNELKFFLTMIDSIIEELKLKQKEDINARGE